MSLGLRLKKLLLKGPSHLLNHSTPRSMQLLSFLVEPLVEMYERVYGLNRLTGASERGGSGSQ